MPSAFSICRRRSKSFDNANDLDEDTMVSDITECYACTHVGIPVFHSTRCDNNANQPQWEASVGSSLMPIHNRPNSKFISHYSFNDQKRRWSYGFLERVYNPRSKRVQKWNKLFLLARGISLIVDPLFFHTLSIGCGGVPCLYMDSVVVAEVALVRTLVDVVHLVHMWLQFRMAYVSRESLAVGRGKLVWDPSSISSHYLRSLKGFWFDAFVLLPLPQVVFWLMVPRFMREERIKAIMTSLFFIFISQFLPKIYHTTLQLRRMTKVTGYIFGTIWWGFALNLIAYLIASHVVGGCWYVLAIQRVSLCLRQQCSIKNACNIPLTCDDEICFQYLLPEGRFGDRYARNSTTSLLRASSCLDINGSYNYGIYGGAFPAISSKSLTFKVLYTFAWGLFNLGTFGNDLEPTSQWFEVIFSLFIVLSGLMLFILLIGNIQVFLEDVMQEKSKMELRCRDMEWWMSRRKLPSLLRQRVRHYERQKWALTGCEDEMELIKDLPEGLRRDIKRFLCLELIRMVPLFHNLDDLILDNICDRVKPLVFSKNEKIVKEGDPVQRMVFIVQGRVKSSQNLSNGVVATNILDPGGYLGDELLSWCLRKQDKNNLPRSFATFTCLEPTEAFELDSNNLYYVTNHFRYKFANERLKRIVRYYSSNWRTWGAVTIQLSWRRYVMRMRRVENHAAQEDGGTQHMLRQYAVIFLSIKPHDHLA